MIGGLELGHSFTRIFFSVLSFEKNTKPIPC